MRITADHAKGISNIGLALVAAAAGIAVLATSTVRASANELIVKFDQSQIIKLPRPVTEIIIGNPMIADVAIQSSNLLVVTGKSFGLTNLIALDADRNVIIDQRVMVQRDNNRLLFLTKGGKRETYNCTPQCNPTITVGDDTTFFNQTAATSERKIRLIEGQTEGGSISASQ
jgi:Pilus formation protein N terminal region